MSYELAESERVGIVALCNQLRSQGCLPDTVEHVREVLTARCCAVNSLAEQLRQRENDAYVFQGMFESQASESQQLRNQVEALREKLSSAERILAALREPSEAVVKAAASTYFTTEALQRAVAAAEREVSNDR